MLNKCWDIQHLWVLLDRSGVKVYEVSTQYNILDTISQRIEIMFTTGI